MAVTNRQGERALGLRMRWQPILLALALVALGAAAGAAPPSEEPIQPDRPGVADGSTVIGPRRFQTETGVQWQKLSSGGSASRTLFTPTLLRFGIDERWEARVETNAFSRVRAAAPGGSVRRTSGYSPISLGAKYQFRQAKESTGNLSLGAILRIFPPSGSSDFRTHHTTSDLRLAADWTFNPNWALNPNVGVARYESDVGRMFTAGLFAATLTYGPNKRFQPFVDVGLQSPEEPAGRTAIFVDGGATYLLNLDTQIDFEIGKGVGGRTMPDVLWTAGISHRFRTGPAALAPLREQPPPSALRQFCPAFRP